MAISDCISCALAVAFFIFMCCLFGVNPLAGMWEKFQNWKANINYNINRRIFDRRMKERNKRYIGF